MHVERHAIQRDDAAEHDADVANREQGRLSLRELGLRHDASPSVKEQARRLPDALGHTCKFPS